MRLKKSAPAHYSRHCWQYRITDFSRMNAYHPHRGCFKMKKKIVLLAMLVAFSGTAMADVTLSAGWVSTKDKLQIAEKNKNLNGANIKFGFEPEGSQIGIISSLSYSADSASASDEDGKFGLKKKYTTMLVGASYKATPWLKPYAMIGGTNSQFNSSFTSEDYTESAKQKKNTFAYSAGVQLYPVDNFFVDLSYEGTKIEKNQVNAFIFGAGFKF